MGDIIEIKEESLGNIEITEIVGDINIIQEDAEINIAESSPSILNITQPDDIEVKISTQSPEIHLIVREGRDGQEVQLRNNGTYIQWKLVTDTSWNNLILLSDISGTDGADGREVQLQVGSGYIQWKYEGESTWNNLIAIADITGADGLSAYDSAILGGYSDTEGQFYLDLADVSNKESLSNKQDDLTTDGTGTKYPTVDAINNAGFALASDIPEELNDLDDVDTTQAVTTIEDADELLVKENSTSLWKKMTGAIFKVFYGKNRGFIDSDQVIATYNVTNRTVTLTGTDIRAIYNWKFVTSTVPTFISGWVSPAHGATDASYFLTFDGTDIDWRNTFNINHVLIAVKIKGIPIPLREVHSKNISVKTHAMGHYGVSTLFQSGGEVSNIVIDSFTATNRRPYFTAPELLDEDLKSDLSALTTNSYQRGYPSGTLSATVINTVPTSTEIIEIATASNNRPYYYENATGTWVKTLVPRITTGTSASRQRYVSVYVLALPICKIDGGNQYDYQWVWIQPQGFSTTIAGEQGRDIGKLYLGELGSLSPEWFIHHQFIIRYKPDEGTGDWNIAESIQIRGTKRSSVSFSGVGVLPTANQVVVDTTNFAGVLTTAEDTAQKVFDRVDDFAEKVWYYSTETLAVGDWTTNEQDIVLTGIVATRVKWFVSDHANLILAGTAQVGIDVVDVTTDTTVTFKNTTDPTDDIEITIAYQL